MSANLRISTKTHYGHIPGLDGLRGLSVILVLFDHSVIYGKFSHLGVVGLDAGSMGVTVFFVLSGYLITTLLLREEKQTGEISLRCFFSRRALRLLPALWFYLFIVAVIHSFGGLQDHPWHSFISSLLYVRNFVGRGHETNHLWSLSIEEQFYLIWPIVMVALPRRNSARLLVTTVGLVSVILWRTYATSYGLATAGALYIRSDFRFDAPLFGCILALIERVAPQAILRANSTPWRSDLLMIFGVGGLVSWIVTKPGDTSDLGIYTTSAGVLAVVFILSQTGVAGTVSRCLTWWPLIKLGQISYGLYLWQQLFLGPPSHGFESIRNFPFGQLASFSAAFASYHFLERPFLRLKDSKSPAPGVDRMVVTHLAYSDTLPSPR